MGMPVTNWNKNNGWVEVALITEITNGLSNSREAKKPQASLIPILTALKLKINKLCLKILDFIHNIYVCYLSQITFSSFITYLPLNN